MLDGLENNLELKLQRLRVERNRKNKENKQSKGEKWICFGIKKVSFYGGSENEAENL